MLVGEEMKADRFGQRCRSAVLWRFYEKFIAVWRRFLSPVLKAARWIKGGRSTGG
jgi:hypothetical protein